MKKFYIFLKYFLFFNPNLFSPFFNNLITRTENVPYGILYIKHKNFFFILLSLLFPIIFLIHGLVKYGSDFTHVKFAIIFISFLSGLWIISNKKNQLEITNASKIFFYFFIILGLIQYIGLLNFINQDIYKIFFARGNLSVGESYRGVSFFFTEVARASYHLIFIYLLAYGLSHKRENFIPFLLLVFYELFLISSTTGIILIFVLSLIRYPKTIIFLLFLVLFLFFALNNIYEIPTFNHYKIDYFLKLLSNYEFDFFLQSFSELSGGRFDSIIFSAKLLFTSPIVNFYDPYTFETTSGRLPVSGPIIFIRTFGIFGLIYLLLFFKSLGGGNTKNALFVFLLGCLYSPNGSWLTLLVVYNEYKKHLN